MCGPIPFKHVYLWCLFFEPHRTSLQSNEHVWLRKVTKLHPNASFTHMYVCICTCRCSQSVYPRVPNSVTAAQKTKANEKVWNIKQTVIVTTLARGDIAHFQKWDPLFPRLFTGILHWRSLRSSHQHVPNMCNAPHDNGTIQKESDTRPIYCALHFLLTERFHFLLLYSL